MNWQSASTTSTPTEEIDLSRVTPDPRWAHALPVSGVRRFRVLALCKVDEEILVAASTPVNEAVVSFLEKHLPHPARIVQADEQELRRLIRSVYPQQVNPASDSGTAETIRVCDELLRAATTRKASDIHLLPLESGLLVRFRVDGVLEDYRSFPQLLHHSLISRIKVLAGMNIAEKREPQDGRFSTYDAANRKVDVRAAAIPTRFGERLTLRLFLPMDAQPTLQRLGMSEQASGHFQAAIGSPYGLVLLTGPTGCGKSTTLYTAMSEVLRQDRGNVITVEDPIEYEIAGASQVEVDSSEKVSFSRALRSILRHDPDVIMLGEIRDAETAEIAVKAALTGHLVFSTLHTNTAAGAVTRLIDMGVEPYLVAATLRLSVAQRLLRRLCPHCRRRIAVDETLARALGRPELTNGEAFEPQGCVYCMGRGHAGRVPLFELLSVDAEVARLIGQQVHETELLEHMKQHANCDLLVDDGVRKVQDGITTIQEVLKATSAW